MGTVYKKTATKPLADRREEHILISAPKGQNGKAQGIALGGRGVSDAGSPESAISNADSPSRPFRAAHMDLPCSQGVALGFPIAPLRGIPLPRARPPPGDIAARVTSPRDQGLCGSRPDSPIHHPSFARGIHAMTDTPPDTTELSRHLAHQFETPEQQFQSGKLGIWLFLGTEILLFSGLFCAYAVYRASHPEVFYYAHLYLSKPLGALNTMVLIFSSFTMASAVARRNWATPAGWSGCWPSRWFARLAFLGVKFIEYKDKWQEGLLTGGAYRPEAPPPGAVVPAVKPRPAVAPGAKPQAAAAVEKSTIAPAAIGPPGFPSGG